MSALLSCPFCRELFAPDEASICPHCDLPLVPLDRLPPSAEGQQEAAAWGQLDPPQDQRLPITYWGRGRGLLFVLAATGLALFFTPWVTIERPDSVTLSGFDLAASRLPWLWGGAVGWFLLLPLVFTRRTVNQLRGIRVIAVTFSVMTAAEVAMLAVVPPGDNQYFSSGLAWAWGYWASALLSTLATVISLRLGGDPADLRDLPLRATDTGAGQPLH